jgi:hypothetical protein
MILFSKNRKKKMFLPWFIIKNDYSFTNFDETDRFPERTTAL